MIRGFSPGVLRQEQPPIPNPLQLIGAVFASLFGLAFGSFLNVVVSRLPEGESIATPGSHCRNCTHTLAWWENLPVLSWLILRGRCHKCHTRISLRYPLIELAVAALWVAVWLEFGWPIYSTDAIGLVIVGFFAYSGILLAGYALLSWLLLALATLDAEHFWLPDRITLPAIGLGLLFNILLTRISWHQPRIPWNDDLMHSRHNWSLYSVNTLISILAPAAIILIIRLAYWLVRRKEGMGLGDAKLMAMLGAWLGLPAALESFALAIFGAMIAALIWLAILAIRGKASQWAKMPLPLGTFLCLGALTEIFYPNWLWTAWTHAILTY